LNEERLAAARVAALFNVARPAYFASAANAALLLFVLWGAVPAAFFPAGDPLLQMAVVFVIGGSIIGAAGVYAASPPAFYLFCAPPFAAVLLRLAPQPGPTYPLLAFMILVFGAVMARVYRDLHGNAVGALRARIENGELVARLTRSEAQLRDAIESFPEGVAVYDADDRLVVCNENYARSYGGGRTAAASSACSPT